jgi:hypothetical protein
MLEIADLIMHSPQLLLLVIILNGVDIMKQWVNKMTIFINMENNSYEDYKILINKDFGMELLDQ